jgi:hypothetical protein
MYNATSNSWTTYPAGLGQARCCLAAASLASGLVFFAGGFTGASSMCHLVGFDARCSLLYWFRIVGEATLFSLLHDACKSLQFT